MSNNKYSSNFLIGAAVAAGVLSALSTLLRPRKNRGGWSEQAKDLAQQMINRHDLLNKNFVLGGMAGGIVGVTTALLLAPKAGSELIKDIYHPFAHDHERKSKSASRTKKVAHKSKAKQRAAHSLTKEQSAHSHTSTSHSSHKKAGKNKHKASTVKKPAAARRRSATHEVSETAEKVAHAHTGETKE